jgi:MFS family permease
MTSLLRERNFRLLWASRTVSAIGSGIVMVAMALAVLEIGGSMAELGLVLACGAVTEVVMLLVGGVWADRLPRRSVMLSVDLVRGAMAATVAVLLLTGNAKLWNFAVIAIVDALGKAFFRPASSGLVAETVQPAKLQQANALLSLSSNSSAVLGPALAGVIVLFSSAGLAYAIDAASFALSALMLLQLPIPKRVSKPKTSFGHDLAQGWREVAVRPWFWQNLITHGLWNFGFSMLFVVGPVLAVQQLGGVASWAAISTGIAVGSVLGSLVALRVRTRRPLVTGNLALVLGATPFVMLALKAPIWAVVAGAVIATVGLAVLGALWNSTLQQLIPTEALSRVTAYDWVVSLSITPLAFASAGFLGATIGITNTVIVCATLVAVPSLLIAFAPQIRAIRRNTDGLIAGPPAAVTVQLSSV